MRRKLKYLFLRSRMPLKGIVARAYLRGVEQYRARRAGSGSGDRTGPDGLPMPPPQLRVLVDGNGDPDFFLRSGRAHMEAIARAIEATGPPFGELRHILDFGCGCGRIGRWLSGLDHAKIEACDYNGELVGWCQHNLPFLHARQTELEPPLPYEAASFELAYAFSVFTHFSVELAERWARELGRVVAPGGRVWLTLHGAAYRERLPQGDRDRFDSGEIIVWLTEIEGTNLCASYWPEAAVTRVFGDDFEVVAHAPPQADALLEHDSYVLRRRGRS